jgi:hypothetical protein
MSDYIDIKNTLNKVRLLNEEVDKQEGVPYGNSDELFNDSIQTAKSQFGADFSKCKTPMIYYPKDDNVILSGEIPTLNNAKFQFLYKDSAGGFGCFLWCDNISLSDENIKLIAKINGVYKNWKQELETSEDKAPMNYKKDSNN